MTEHSNNGGYPIEQIREDFPILQTLVRGKPLVYLDSAATTQKPQLVIDATSRYYEAVNANPSIALMDMDCEEMCYVSWHLYEEKFGEVPPSGISLETCSNLAKWPSE